MSTKPNPFYRSSTKEAYVTALEPAANSQDSTAVLSSFAPWSLPAALILIVGILFASQEAPLGLVLVATLMLGLCYAPKASRWMLPFILLLPLGFARYEIWDAQLNPMLDFLGQEISVSGVTDGRYLTLDDPKGARLVLSSRSELEAGRVSLRGEFALAAGKRNPGGFDYRGYLRRRNIWGQFFVDEVIASTPVRFNIRDRLARGVTSGLGQDEAALMQAMTLGIRDDLGDLRDIFSASGLAHILALSGLHVGILVIALGIALSPLQLLRYPILILLIVGFVFLVGPTPSVMRASAMAVAALLSLWLGSGRIDPWASLALSAILVLLWQPSWLFDLSFQLSYLAVIGLLVFTEPLSQLLLGKQYHSLANWHWKKLLVISMIVSIAAQLTTLPLVASSFGSLPILSPITNVFAIPLASIMVPLGFLAGVLGLFIPIFARALNIFTQLFAFLLIKLAELGAKLPNLVWGEVSWLGYVLFYIGIAALALVLHKKLRPLNGFIIVFTAVACSMLSTAQSNKAEIIILDVGQGDSALIRLPNRVEILMDGGGTPFGDYDVGARTVVPALKALGIDELELVIASHADADHIEGLISVLGLVKVQTLVIGARNEDKLLFNRLIATAERKEITILEVARGQILYVGDAQLDILNPPRKPFDQPNDNSVAFVLRYQNEAKALLMGDLPSHVEADIAFPKVDIVMAAHHGSKSSTSLALLKATQPEHLVFSYGRNNFGHPYSEIISNAELLGTKVHETFKTGSIRLSLD